MNRQGFSLVELMVVLAILGVVMTGVLGVVTSQNKAYHSEEAIIDLQMNGRLAINYISRYVRMGGFGCYGNIDTSNPVNGFGAVINATDGASNTPDTLTVVTSTRKVGIVDDKDVNAGESFLSTSVIPIDLDDSSYNLTSFFDNSSKRYVYFAPCENTDFLSIQSPVDTADTSFTISKAIRVDEGAEVFTVRAYTFALSGNNLTINNNTGSGNQELAENIENLQFQYGWDRNGDSRFDPTDNNEWGNDPSGNEADIKAVRIFVLSRSGNPDRDYSDKKKYKINEATASTTAVFVGPFNDGYHRSLLQTTIMVRNLNF